MEKGESGLLVEAWNKARDSAKVPVGTKMYVRAARASESGGTLFLTVPLGGLSVMARSEVLDPLREEVGKYLGPRILIREESK